MSLTTNIGLRLTDADEVTMTFLEWRTLMNGVGVDSNMELIDKKIGQMENNFDELGLAFVDGKLCVKVERG